MVTATIFGIADKVKKQMELKVADFDTDTMYVWNNYMLSYSIARSINRSVSSSLSQANSTISRAQAASSSYSSGGGFGGGSSFGGGGGGGGGGEWPFLKRPLRKVFFFRYNVYGDLRCTSE